MLNTLAMSRRFAGLVSGLLLAAVLSPCNAQAKTEWPHLVDRSLESRASIKIEAPSVVGGDATVSGRVPGRVTREVQLQQRFFMRWLTVDRVGSDRRGQYRFSRRIAVPDLFRFRVLAPASRIRGERYAKATSLVSSFALGSVIEPGGIGPYRIGMPASQLVALGALKPQLEMCTIRYAGTSSTIEPGLSNTVNDLTHLYLRSDRGVPPDLYRTPEGLGLGSTLAQLREVYGPQLSYREGFAHGAVYGGYGIFTPEGSVFFILGFDESEVLPMPVFDEAAAVQEIVVSGATNPAAFELFAGGC